MLQCDSVHDVRRPWLRGWWSRRLWVRRPWAALLLLLSWAPLVQAHDLAIDQLVLWPDRTMHELRGELTFDPELTRSKDELPSPRAQQRVLQFLAANLRITLDGRELPVQYEVRELWVRGGATLGDLVVFTAALPESARELRVFAEGFRALVVSDEVPSERSRSEATSWLLGPAEWTPVVPLGVGGASPAGLAGHFIRLGFEHILPQGVDHMLFVAGIVLGNVRRYRRVLLSLTLFTLAHTLTLALSNLLAVRMPAQLVEPLIALSICFLGVDNLRQRSSMASSEVGRQLLVFCFGLVHGLGFANALSELAFDREHLLLALFSFNVGVELGQLAVVVLLALVLYWIVDPRALRRYVTFPGSVAIAASGLFLMLERSGLGPLVGV